MGVPNYYTSPFQVGSHHYARAFEKLGYEVAYMSDPISPLHSVFAKNADLHEREKIYHHTGFQKNHIWYYVPKAFIAPQNKPILSSKLIMDNWFHLTKPNLIELLTEKGFGEVDLIWIDSPLFHFLLDKIKHKKSILRLADFSKGFDSTSKVHFNKEVELVNRVDKVIYTAKNIKEQYKGIKNSKMHYMPNGIDLDFFKTIDKDFPKEFENIPEPRVIYIGAIEKWFDIDLVYTSAQSLPTHSFVLVGTSSIDLSKLEQLANIFILGRQPHNRIGQFLYHSQTGIIPFKQDEFVDSIHPLKLYEYAAAGLNIVSTKWKEIQTLSKYINIANDHEEFIHFLKQNVQQDTSVIQTWLKESEWTYKVQEALEL